jgi:hypothetical protein
MCDWCKAKAVIAQVMDKLGLEDKGLDKLLRKWDCEDGEEESSEDE